MLYFPFLFFSLLGTEFLRVDFGVLKIPMFNFFIALFLAINLMRFGCRVDCSITKLERNFILMFFLYTFVCICSVFLSVNINSGFSYISKLLFVFVFWAYLKSFNGLDARIIEGVVKVVSVTSSCLMCVILYKYIFVFNVFYISPVLTEASEVGKNQLSLYLIVTTSMVFWLWVGQDKVVSIYLIAFLIHVISLLLVFSKASMLIFSVSSILMFVLAWSKAGRLRNKRHLLNVGFFVVLMFVIGLLVLLSQEGFRENMLENINWFLEGGDQSYSTNLRKYYLSRSLDYFMENPLFGIGINNFPHYVGGATHNSYMQVLAEVGLVGFIPFVSYILIMFRQSLMYKPQCTFEIGIQQALIASLLYLLFINASNTLIIYVPFLLLVCINRKSEGNYAG